MARAVSRVHQLRRRSRTFRYHEVLRRHLESVLLDELGPGPAWAWIARAVAILEPSRLPARVRAYVRAERWSDATRLLRDDGENVIRPIRARCGTTCCRPGSSTTHGRVKPPFQRQPAGS